MNAKLTLLILLTAGIIPAAHAFTTAPINVTPDPPSTPTEPPGEEDTSESDPINLTTGAVWNRMTDIAIPCPGFDLVLKRAYSSKLMLADMPFGKGWTHSLDPRILFSHTGTVYFSPGDGDILKLRENVSYNPEFGPPVSIARATVLDEDLKLSSLPDGWRLTSPGFVYADFSKDGLIRRKWNAAGQFIDFIRDSSNRLERVEHSCGQSVVFEYSGSSPRISRVYVPGQNLSVDYTISFHPWLETVKGVWDLFQTRRITSSGTEVENFNYEMGSHYMTACKKRDGLTFRYAYTNVNSVIPSEPPHRNAASVYGEPGRLYEYKAEYVDAEKSIAREVRDGQIFETSFVKNMVSNQPLEIRHPCSETAFYSYAEGTRLLDKTVWKGKPYDDAFDIIVSDKYAAKYERDAEHRVTSVRHAFFRSLGDNLTPLDTAPSWSVTYDAAYRLPATFTDSCGRISGTDYSAQGLALTNWTEQSSGVRLEESFSYTDGLLSEYRDQEGRQVSFGYGAGGYVTSVTPSVGSSLSLRWNTSLGILTNIIFQGLEGTSRFTARETDELGRVRRVVRPDGLAETFLRDATGRVTNHVDVAGRIIRTTYHPGGKPSEIIQDANGLAASVRFDYSQQMDSLRIRDPLNREVERYVLDGLGRAEKVYDIEGREMTVRYRLGDIVSSVTRFAGTAISFDYDIGARLTRVTYPDGTTTYGWLPCGRPAAATNTVATVGYGYDGAGRLVSESVRSRTSSFPDLTLSNAFDRSGLATNTVLSIPGVTVLLAEKASYDQAARLAAQTSEAGTFTNSYCAWSGGLETVSNSCLAASYASDLLDRVTNITYRTAGGEIVRSFAFAYDLAGMITQKVAAAVASCVTNVYAYDGLGRLTNEVTRSGGSATTNTFSYDKAGNRLASVYDGVISIYSYGVGNRLSTASDGTGYTHDNAGNVSRIVRYGAALDLVWNLQGQLLAVTNNGVLAESYTYDPLGRRQSTTADGTTVYHAYNGDECIADLDASGNLLRSYTWGQGIDNLLAMTVYGASETNTFFAVKDHLGSVNVLVDFTGNVVESFTYDAWGNILSHFRTLELSNFSCRYMFQGREYSYATGLYSFRARWYDSKAGRWISNDPIGVSGGLNLYAFCGNNPVNFRDPQGLEWKIFPSTGGIIGYSFDPGPVNSVVAGAVGKVWNLPNTAIGLSLGLVVDPFGIGIGGNSIKFEDFPMFPGGLGLALGNVTFYKDDECSKYGSDIYTVGEHELQHTRQGELLGPLYLPAYFIGGIGQAFRGEPFFGKIHFMERGPYSLPPQVWR